MRLRILTPLAALLLSAFALISCSDISESDRLAYVRPADVRRTVLIEDFTGQRCVWCPDGNDAISQLEQQYGDSVIISVAIHSGPLGFRGNARTIGLATDLGDTYYYHYGVESQPSAQINRRALSPLVSDWPARIRSALEQPARLSISLSTAFDSLSRVSTINIGLLPLDSAVSGRLQIWLTEDSLTALQMMPDGSANPGYIHNHVLRAAVNGVWGDTISIAPAQERHLTYSYTLPQEYNARQCRFVVFVYNNDGVLQAARSPVSEQRQHP